MKKINPHVVYDLLKQVPAGNIVRYKDIAEFLGHPKAVRVIGNILNKNKDIIEIPCHRVVKSSGEIGGYNHGMLMKNKLLKEEGISIVNNKIKNISKYLYSLSKNIAQKKTKENKEEN
jgi:methylated-DNA-[protein]-cysteine S-methyltransferase